MAVTAATLGFQKFISIPSQGLGPIKWPLTTSFYSNIRKVLKEGIKPKYGETPTSRSLSKLLKSGTHAKPSPRRVAFLSRRLSTVGSPVFLERSQTFSHYKTSIFASVHYFPPLHVFAFEFVGETTTILFCLLVTYFKFHNDRYVPLFSVLIFGSTSAVHFLHLSTHATYGT